MAIYLNMLCLTSYSQNIAGIVKDENNQGLGWANVSLLDNNNHFLDGVITTDDGFFNMKVEKLAFPCKLVARYAGMKPDTLVVNDVTRQIVFCLKPEENMLEEVKVIAPQTLFRDKGDVITADVANTILSKSGTLDNLMNQIPFVSGSDGSYNVFGRGNALLYVNGHKLYDANELKMLSADKIKKIEVITNPSSKYSSDIKAVIKIYTKDNPNGLGGNVMAYLQQGRKFSNYESGSLIYNHNKVQIQGSLSYSDTRMKQYAQDKTEIIKMPISYNTDNVEINYKGLNGSANIGINYTINNKKSIGLNTRINLSKFNNDVNLKSLAHYTGNTKDFEASSHALSINKPVQWINNVYYIASFNKTHMELTNDFIIGRRKILFGYLENTDANVNTNSVMHYLMNSTIADFNTALGKGFNLGYGAEITFSRDRQHFAYDEENINTGLAKTSNERKQLLNAEYLNLKYDISNWHFSLGLRYEYTQLNYYENKMKKEEQSRNYNDFFPNINISFSPTKHMNLSLGYRKTIQRPGYGVLNDNIQYNSRFSYVQGNSRLVPEYVHSINFLGSYKNLRVVASYEKIKNAIQSARSIYENSNGIILSRTENMPNFERLNFGINWWQKFGFYTPYLELNIGKQNFKYQYQDGIQSYNNPFYSFKIHHTFNLPNNYSMMLFIDFTSNKYNLFREYSHRWKSQVSVSKSLKGGWYIQLNCNNFFCSSKNTSITYCDWIKDATYNDSDYHNISLMVSYNFNYKRSKYSSKVKSSEIKRF